QKVPLKRWEDWERARIRRNKRTERQERNQPRSPTHLTHQVYAGDDQNNSLLASNYINYEGDYQDAMSMHSNASGDIGPQQQYYDYSTNRYPSQDNYDRYQQEQFDNARYGNTHDLQRAPSPRLPENKY
ncbi:1288_t:CDS:1, partial [Scutellospora calospora]